jgi:pimeloyl-ACP methyl ester carboxylesterase
MDRRRSDVGESVTRRVPGPNGELAVEERGGGGLPVLFVHGNGGSSKLWHRQLEYLSPSRRALAVDLHGFGDSQCTTAASYTVESFAADLEAVTWALEIERLVLVGHSLGGAVVARFAVAHRERVAAVLYVDSVGDTRMPESRASSFAADLRLRGEPDRALEWFQGLLAGARTRTRELVLAELAGASREALAGAFLALTRVDPSRWIAGFGGPALHIFVSKFNRGAASLCELLPSLSAVAMEDVSHWPMIDRPEAFNRHLGLFLDGVDCASDTRTG